MGTPEISVVVPVYNAEKYLRQCVESVLAQTYSDWELILIDDGSTDSCPVICDNFATLDNRIISVHTQNGGFSKARNNGLDRARGRFITFLDADDILHPQFLELAIKGIKETGTDVISFSFTNRSDLLNKPVTEELKPKILDGVSFSELVLYQNKHSHPCSVWAKLYRHTVLQEIRFTPSIGYEDLDLFYRLYPKLRSIAVSNLKLYYYRPNPSSYIHTFKENRKDVLDVTDRMKSFFSESGEYPDEKLYLAAMDRRLSANFNILGLMAANRFRNPELESRCWKSILEERKASLTNPKVRLKNKVAILISYIGGRPLIRLLSSIIY